MKSYDVVIVGAATSGSFLARRLAEAGRRVLVIDQKAEAGIGARYDIFHIVEQDFATFCLPMPCEGDDFAFRFSGGAAYSALNRYPKESVGTTIGMHMHAYTLRLNRWAAEAGAELLYEATFVDFLYTDGWISGVVYEKDGKRQQAACRLVADCSGIPSVARRKLPDDYGVENFEIGPTEMFYVTLRYAKYQNEGDYVKKGRSWPFYKTWEAPEADPHGAILGVGANLSFDVGEQVFQTFEKTVPLPAHTIDHIERGVTPYRRPPYSFVADGFLAAGDAACLTKPSAGEGVTSSMVQLEIAAAQLNLLLSEGRPLTRENLWPINKRYIEAQGQAFASQLATLAGAVATNEKENDFFFEKDVIFSKKSFEAMGEGKALTFTAGELIGMAFKMLWGILAGRLRPSTLRALLDAMRNGGRIAAHYATYPDTPTGFETWCETAEAIWTDCGSMADALQ